MTSALTNAGELERRLAELIAICEKSDTCGTDAYAAAMSEALSVIQQQRAELDDLKHRLRMIVSHASGGALHESESLVWSVNDISVEISRHRNEIWKQAQEAALRDADQQQRVRIAELEAGLERIADPRNIHFAGDAQIVARTLLGEGH